MPKIKICAVQFRINPDFNKNISRVEQFFKKANKNNCDIICFPEIFATGPLNRKKYDAIIMDPPVYGHGPKGETWDFFKQMPLLLSLTKS